MRKRCLIGAYTSMQSIKQKHIELENMLFTTEKLCSMAELNGLYAWNREAIQKVEKSLAMLEFHDVASGTCAQDGEKSCLRRADYALELLQQEFDKAFFSLCTQYTKAGSGEFPVFLFNPQPYERDTVCETEFLMPKALVSDTQQYTVTAYQNGRKLPTQCIKELSNIHYDRRKRIAYRCTLSPLGVTRVDFRVEVTPKVGLPKTEGTQIVFSDSMKTIHINRTTGLMESYVTAGKELISGGAFQPVICEDNADPWGWYMDKIGKNPESMRLSECRQGPFGKLKNVNVIENGDVLTEVESFFEGNSSFVRISYKMYRDMPYTDVRVDVLWNEQQKVLKIKLPCAFDGAFIGQIPFGTDEFRKDGGEIHAQRFVGFQDEDRVLALYNNCTFGFSAEGNDLCATLLRGAAYCAHPIEDRALIDENRFIPYIEQGKRSFSFRLSYDRREKLENNAQEFVNQPYSLNFFPHGNGRDIKPILRLENQAVSLSAFYRTGDAYTLRFVNNNEHNVETNLMLCGKLFHLDFGRYEAKTFLFDGSNLQEQTEWC